MRLKISNYRGPYRIVSIALDEDTKKDLLEDKLDFIYVYDDQIILYPDNYILTKAKNIIKELQSCSDFDVFELFENGILNQCYDNSSIDNYFFVTGRCNSNCIMCPSSERARKTSENYNIETLIEIARHIPADTPHLTITGGEPFLLGERVFEFIAFLKEKFRSTEFLFLTNGRIFAVDKYVQLFRNTIPDNTIVAIPLHASTEEIHDAITQAKGSFEQTFTGIKKLLSVGIRVELRIVVNKMNVNDISKLARLVTDYLPQVEYVSIIAMEMTGSAFANRDKVWISYKDSSKYIAGALIWLINNGINVRLYNFPLCTIDPCFWPLCEKSISSIKVRFTDECRDCRYKDSCGGVFAGTLMLERNELEAIK